MRLQMRVPATLAGTALCCEPRCFCARLLKRVHDGLSPVLQCDARAAVIARWGLREYINIGYPALKVGR